MVTEAGPTPIEFSGTEPQRRLAARAADLLRGRGRFMASDAAIRVSVASLVEVLGATGDQTSEADVVAMIGANAEVFALEQVDGQQLIVTTRSGHAPVARSPQREHDFQSRFTSPRPKPAAPVEPIRERPRVDPSWATLAASLGDLPPDEEEERAAAEEAAEAARTAAEDAAARVALQLAAAAAAAEEQAARHAAAGTTPPTPDFAAPRLGTVPAPQPEIVVEEAPAPIEEDVPAAPAVLVEEPEVPAVAAPVAPRPVEELPPVEVVPVEDDLEADVIVADEEPAVVAPVVPAPAPVPAPAVPAPRPTPVRPALVLPTTDVSAFDDAAIAAAVGERLRADARVAHFGNQWMAEDRVPRFSRGDLRRMKDYIQEQEQPLTDEVLAQDVLGGRPGTPDFDLLRFAVNFRLSREHRDFDFVGTNDQRFWSTSSLPQIGTTRRKPNELGTDYRFLLEETASAAAPRSSKAVDHVLTFFEYYHGLLPYDAELQALLPAPLLPDQRSVVLTFETPQSYTTYLVELRYPTPNRGGYVLGLDDFYAENLVPGALLSITATENDGHYRAEYLPVGNQSARLLELDERRALRYVFRPTTYACGVADEMLISEERFPRLGSERPLDEKLRRRPESVVAATFERIGDQSDGPGYLAPFQDLFAAVNIERPFSEAVLRAILDNDETGAFAKDPDREDAYTYVPGSPS